jgi:hypothetical protein
VPQFRSTLAAQACRIAIKSNGRILFVDPSEVLAVRAEGNDVLLERKNGQEYTVTRTYKKELEISGAVLDWHRRNRLRHALRFSAQHGLISQAGARPR